MYGCMLSIAILCNYICKYIHIWCVRQSIRPSVRLSVSPSVRLSVSPPVRLSVCPTTNHLILCSKRTFHAHRAAHTYTRWPDEVDGLAAEWADRLRPSEQVEARHRRLVRQHEAAGVAVVGELQGELHIGVRTHLKSRTSLCNTRRNTRRNTQRNTPRNTPRNTGRNTPPPVY